MLLKRIIQIIIILFVHQSSLLRAQDDRNLDEQGKRKPQTFALIVGVSKYKNASPSLPNLQYATADAIIFADFLKSPVGGGLADSTITLLIDSTATKKNIQDHINLLLRKVQDGKIISGDKLIFFFSGHGGVITSKTLHFFPHDANPNKAVQKSDLLSYNINVGSLVKDFEKWGDTEERGIKSILIFDACKSISVSSVNENMTHEQKVNYFLGGAKSIEKDVNDYILFSASAPGEKASEVDTLGHGIFTYYMIQGLLGEADEDPKNHIVDFGELSRYLMNQVPKYSKKIDTTAVQEPVIKLNNYSKERFSIQLTSNQAKNLRDKFKRKINPKEANKNDMYASAKKVKKGKDAETILEGFSFSDYRAFFNTAMREKKLINPANDCALYFYKKMAEIDSASSITSSSKADLEGLIIEEVSEILNNDLSGLRVSTQMENKVVKETKSVRANENNIKETAQNVTGTSKGEEKSENQKNNSNIYYKNAIQLLNTYRELSGDSTETSAVLQYFTVKDLLTNQDEKSIMTFVCQHLQKYEFSSSGDAISSLPSEQDEAFLTYVIAESLIKLDGDTLKCFNNFTNISRLAESFLLHTVSIAPHWSHPLNALGELFYAKSNKVDLETTQKEALRKQSELYFQKAIDINPNDPFPYLNQGDFFMFDRANYRKALEKYLTAYGKDPKQLKTMMRLSQAYSNLYMFDKAEKLLRLALAYAPENKELLYQMGDFYFNNRRDKPQAIAYYKKPTEIDSLDVEAWVILGSFYHVYFDTKYDEAIQCYKKALELDSTKFDLYQSIASCYSWKNDRNKALETLLKPIKLQPNNSKHYLSFGEMCSDNKRAIANYEKALQLDPTNPDIYFSLANAYYLENNKEKSEEFITKYYEVNDNLYFFLKFGLYFFNAEFPDDKLKSIKSNGYTLRMTNDGIARAAHFLQDNFPHLRVQAANYFRIAIARGYEENGYYYYNSTLENEFTNLVDLMSTTENGQRNKKGIHDANRYYKNSIKWRQTNANLYYALAYLNRKYVKNQMAAISYYQKAVALQPDQFSFVYPEIAACYISIGDRDEAWKTIDQYQDNYPDDPSVEWNTGNFFNSTLKDPKKAIEYYEKALALDSTFMEAYSSMYDLLVQSSSKSDIKKARQVLEKQCRIDPYNIDNLTKLGLHHLNYLKDTLKAIEYFSKAITLDTLSWSWPSPIEELASIYLVKKDSISAKKIYSLKYNLYPSPSNINDLAYNYEYNLNEPINALKLYLKSYAIDSSTYTLQNIASLYSQLGKLDSAEMLYKKSITIKPIEYMGYYYLAEFYRSQKRSDEAVQVLKDGLTHSSIGLQDEYTNPYYDISQVYLYNENANRSDTTNAISNLEKAIQNNPRFFQAYTALGNIYYSLGNKEKAWEWLKKPVKIEPSNPARYTDVASQLFALSDYIGAIKMYNKALKLDKSMLETYYGDLANCYASQNKISNAIAVCDRALKQFPSKKEEILVRKGEIYKGLNLGSGDMTITITSDEHLTESLKTFKYVLRIDQDSTMFTTCVSNIGEVFTRLAQYDSARVYYEILVSRDSSGIFLMKMADAYWNCNDLNHADQYYFKGLSTDSYYHPYFLGKKFLDSARSEIARKYFRKAITFPSTSKLEIGYSYYYLSELNNAEKIFSELQEQDTQNSEVLLGLIMVNIKLNKLEKALEWLKKDMEDGHLAYDPKTHADLEELRKTPEFQAMMKAYEEK